MSVQDDDLAYIFAPFGSDVVDMGEPDEEWLPDSADQVPSSAYQFGDPPGVKPGDVFENRHALARAGVHAVIRAGIHGQQDRGAFSIVMSGGYEDDKDHGNWVLYVGTGGLEKTFENSMNKSLLVGDLLHHQLLTSPMIQQAEMKKGHSGFQVCVFELQRLPNQPPLPPSPYRTSTSANAQSPTSSSPTDSQAHDPPHATHRKKKKRTRPDHPDEQHDSGRHRRRHAASSEGGATTRTREDVPRIKRKRVTFNVTPLRDGDDDHGEPVADTSRSGETLRTPRVRTHKRNRAQRARTSAVPLTASVAAAEHSSAVPLTASVAAAEHSSAPTGPSPLPAQDHAICSSLLAGAERRPYRLYTKDDRGTPVPDMVTMFWREQGPEAIRQQSIMTDCGPPRPSHLGASSQSTSDGSGPAGSPAAQADPVTHTPTKPSTPVSELPPTEDVKVTSPAPPSVPPCESPRTPSPSTSPFAKPADVSATTEYPDPVEIAPDSACVAPLPSFSVAPDSQPRLSTPPVVHVQLPSDDSAECARSNSVTPPHAEPSDAVRPGMRDDPIVVEDYELDVRETKASSSTANVKYAIIDLTLD
ncbi:hypothetical protein BN946_scf184462.g2 [Trametes cinnabarina]|uniref:YDG domain-containing protein n=1 Tax=Pycnoporus cinnabarinus TaxID=5643 RepID=A0A060SUC1_PYCCI|nr:hypothetical protein BN946_scf184462.g2 [Trametes cinnabarina]